MSDGIVRSVLIASAVIDNFIRNKKCETIKKEEVIDFSLILYLVINLSYFIFSQFFFIFFNMIL